MNAQEFVSKKQALATMITSDDTQAIDAYVNGLITEFAHSDTVNANFTVNGQTYWIFADEFNEFELINFPNEYYSWQDLNLIIMGMVAEANGKLDDFWQVFGNIEKLVA